MSYPARAEGLVNSTMGHKSTNNKTKTNHPRTFQEKFLNIQNNFPDYHQNNTDGSKQAMKLG